MLGGCAHMDATEFGAYMSLIITCYQTNNILPDDDNRLARMARVTVKVWKRIKPTIAVKFSITDGKWSHDVIRRELVKYSSLSTKNKSNALKRYETDLPVADESHCQTPANTSNNNQVTNNNSSIVPPAGATKPKSSRKIGTRLPDDWSCSMELGEWAMSQGMTGEEVKNEILKFIDYWQAKSGKDATKVDWNATFRNWIRNSKDWKR